MNTCSQCEKEHDADSMVQFGDDWVCENCRPAYVQKMKEGVPTAIHPAAGDEAFITLMQVCLEDDAMREQVLAILRLDSFNRVSLLNKCLISMQLHCALVDFGAAVSYFKDDRVAQRAIDVLTGQEGLTNEEPQSDKEHSFLQRLFGRPKSRKNS